MTRKELYKDVKQRIKNPQFYIRIVLVSFLPIAAAMAIEPQSLTSWKKLIEVLQAFLNNPYLIGLYLFTLYQSFLSSKKEEENEEEN